MERSVQTDWLAGVECAAPPKGSVRAGHFRGFIDFVLTRGGDPRSILERHGIDPVSFADPDSFIDCPAAINMLEYCARQFGDPLFGARLARRQSADVFGAATALGRAAPTVREGLHSVREFLPVVHFGEGAITLATGRERAEHRWTNDGLVASNAQGNLQSLVLQMKLLQTLGGPDFQPDYVLLRADFGAAEVEELQGWMGCSVAAHQEHNAIGFFSQILDWPVLTSNKLLFSIIHSSLEKLRETRPGCTEKVKAYLRDNLAGGNCSLERCAKALGVSRRMLQWRLQADGWSFSDMVENERIGMARSLLTGTGLSMIEIAGRLGYSEQSSFGRACQRWFGLSPGALRRSSRACLSREVAA